LWLVEEFVFKRLWKSAALSKVCAFAWQLLLDRVPKKDNLFKRRIIQVDQLNGRLCSRSIEKANHLFPHCDFATKVWYEIIRWLRFCVAIPPKLSISFAMWATCVNNKKENAVMCLIWNAYIWSLWRVRNDCVFNNAY
jgi:hypothetical protein